MARLGSGSNNKRGSRVDKLLNGFRRYRRALQRYQGDDWTDEDINQWISDRKYYSLEYEKNRCKGFGIASDCAVEQLFIRCCIDDAPMEPLPETLTAGDRLASIRGREPDGANRKGDRNAEYKLSRRKKEKHD